VGPAFAGPFSIRKASLVSRCALVLDDESWYEGYSFGSPAVAVDEMAAEGVAPKGIGEVVFNTAMTGYHEVLTDPS